MNKIISFKCQTIQRNILNDFHLNHQQCSAYGEKTPRKERHENVFIHNREVQSQTLGNITDFN